MRQTVSLDRELHKGIKLICVENGITINDLIDKIVEKYLSMVDKSTPLDI